MDGKNLKLKAWLVEHGIKQTELAELLDLDLSNVNEKLNGKQDFTLAQVRTICATYDLSADIFLP